LAASAVTGISKPGPANGDDRPWGGAASPASGVLIVCGLKREASILAGAHRLSACGGGSTLKRRLAELAGSKPQLVLSWGLCGGLDPRLRPGNLAIGDEVSFREERIRTDEGVASALKRRLSEAGEQVSAERFAAAEAPILTADEKAQLRLATGAAAVDMESLVAGRFAAELGAPFAILRAVADPAERNLPPLAAKAIDAEGHYRNFLNLQLLVVSPKGEKHLLPLAQSGPARVVRQCVAVVQHQRPVRHVVFEGISGIGLDRSALQRDRCAVVDKQKNDIRPEFDRSIHNDFLGAK